MTDRVDIGFVPLTDAANLIIAHELGFDQDEGVEFVLHKDVSWSNIRDKVSLGIYPMAHMLSPLSISMSLGLGPLSAGITVPIVLSRNGNTLTVSADLAERLVPQNNLRDLGAALGRVFERPLRIGVPYPHSMHQILVRYWLSNCGVDLQKQVEFAVAPPSMLMDVLNAGEIDAFMVGEPWGSLAVQDGAHILICGADIWNDAPEKVLGVRRDWADDNPDTLDKVVRAIYRASLWCQDPANVIALSEILSMSRYLDVPLDIISRAITGNILSATQGQVMAARDIIRLSGTSALMPWKDQAAWIVDQAAPHWGLSRKQAIPQAREVFRPDLYRRALEPLSVNYPIADESPAAGSAESGDIDRVTGAILGKNGYFHQY